MGWVRYCNHIYTVIMTFSTTHVSMQYPNTAYFTTKRTNRNSVYSEDINKNKTKKNYKGVFYGRINSLLYKLSTEKLSAFSGDVTTADHLFLFTTLFY